MFTQSLLSVRVWLLAVLRALLLMILMISSFVGMIVYWLVEPGTEIEAFFLCCEF